MTPKEKAEQLVDSFYWELENDYKAKQCALIAVDEIIEVAYWNGVKDYWKEVKQELENI